MKLLEDMDIATFIIGKETADDEVVQAMDAFQKVLESGKDVAFVIRKGPARCQMISCCQSRTIPFISCNNVMLRVNTVPIHQIIMQTN